ncbi:MAG: hypothetical protein AMXMBFR58_26030 [Phycisphaerae bacterium]|nr:hypothetical protein [Phycisphaerales bacterium]MCK6475856.1 SPOR domain-containing protein [Phycisphaerales bacterium]
MNRPMPIVIAGICACLMLTGPGGCASSSGGASGSTRAGFIDDYSAGNYAAAYASASAAAKNPSNSQIVREQAMLIAGEAAHAMDRNADARTWLAKVSTSSDPQITGKAQATLGLIALEEGSMSQASELLGRASDSLDGDEAARAALYAGDACRASSRETEARRFYQKAGQLARLDQSLQRDIAERLSGSGRSGATVAAAPVPSSKPPFTLQLGAFSSPQKAHQQAAKLKPQTSRLALGQPKVVPVFRSGKILYSVRVGTFASRTEADRAKSRLQGSMVISAQG